MVPGTLTPSDEEEEPLPQALGGIGHDNGRVQVAALHEHPEEVSHHEVVEDSGDAAAPGLQGVGQWSGAQCAAWAPTEGRSFWGFANMALNTLKPHPGKGHPLSFLSLFWAELRRQPPGGPLCLCRLPDAFSFPLLIKKGGVWLQAFCRQRLEWIMLCFYGHIFLRTTFNP